MAALRPPPAAGGPASGPPVRRAIAIGGLGSPAPHRRALALFSFESFYKVGRDSPTLCPLPVELLAEVVRHVDRKSDLRVLCRVSRLFRDLAERQRYAHVRILHRTTADWFNQMLRSRPARQAFVRRFSVALTPDPFNVTGVPSVSPLLDCRNLERLEISSAAEIPIAGRISSAAQFPISEHDPYSLLVLGTLRIASLCTPEPQRVFRCLTILRIDLSSPRHTNTWNVILDTLQEDIVHVFLSPTLRQITLRGATISQPTLSYLNRIHYENFSRKTPLQVLRLPSCYVDAQVLQMLLTLPCALRVLHIEPGSSSSPHQRQSVVHQGLGKWTHVFMQQQHALEEIAFIAPRLRDPDVEPGEPLDLRAMQALSTVAGDVFHTGSEELKAPDHVQVVGSEEYKRSLRDTRWR